jgi:hypothetical protein
MGMARRAAGQGSLRRGYLGTKVIGRFGLIGDVNALPCMRRLWVIHVATRFGKIPNAVGVVRVSAWVR